MLVSSDLDCPVMVSAGRLGRPKDAFDKLDTLRRHNARRAFEAARLPDLGAACATMAQITAAIHSAPSHLAPRLYPLAMQAAATLDMIEAARGRLYAVIDAQRGAA